MHYSHTNITAILNYNYTFVQNFQAICQPLIDCFPITHFIYIRVFKDGHFIILSHDLYLIEKITSSIIHYENILYETSHLNERVDLNKHFWPTYKEENLLNTSLLSSLGLINGLNIIKKAKDGSLEFFIFATNSQDKSIQNICLNYLALFERFIFYFKVKASKIINNIHVRNLGFSSFYENEMKKLIQENLFKEKMTEFIQHTSLRKYEILDKNNTKVNLSKRQVQCLYRFSQGRTAKEIARDLNISYRTVQTHLNIIKDKINSSTKSEVIDCLSKDLKTYLEIDENFCR